MHPEIDLHMSFSDDVVNLARREADISLRVADEVTDNVVGRKLVPMSWAAYCSKD
jgi:DNA-binding transcriptional LysR family regulator